ncbi:uncharacterized protein LOC122372617 isoform X1 [Amphibalanus amphitrite]|uniref:uncharacterized protein LOC122372617 isoform X1 n=1 Tax=Amphibalanus amphitrite TaxID=1232801 RepID=UPI001C910B17|nr:uncharacterized protein LOC122372617 isoform X1 [Amphibalanus amphitrite]XP_043205990.1 uncharacterized protein LOC122372617 isoform X1 [Amphibalanus amphitrite]XP_043205991.1 uncharacterized protein LOC122372617 isoform X1 [Amphibalanus amphitrite]XP_043205992.1 uncharacterized protein LOC122372617 isoform X1 [Amphibalanus amphitrite]
MSPPPGDSQDQEVAVHRQLPSIPILQCRWGLGEGVSPMVFKPLTIPRHLIQSPDGPPPEPARRPRGRGRASGLSCHDDPLPVPGNLANVGVSNLTIQEQINRVRRDLPIYEPPTNYSQYILPRHNSQDDDFSELEPETAATPPPRLTGQVNLDDGQRGGWNLADFLDPGGVVAVESALLPAAAVADGDTQGRPSRLLGHLGNDSDDPDICEERTNSSDMSDEWQPRRVWRPRPPPLDEQSFPPLQGAADAPDRSSSRAARASGWAKPVTAALDSATTRPEGRNGSQAGKRPKSASQSSTAASSVSGADFQSAPSAPSLASHQVTEDTASARMHVTGVTDANWDKVQEYVQAYGSTSDPQRGPGGHGWFSITPPESAEWIVSVHSSTQW